MPWAVIGGLAGVAVTALVTWLVAARKTSGRVDTTEASVLWAEAEKMRTVYREEGERCRDEALALRTETVALRAELASLRQELAGVRLEASRWREEVVALKEQILARRADDA